MWPAVRAIFPAWSAQFEGRVPFPYLDVEDLVTTGVGNKVETLAEFQALPWLRPDGSPASTTETEDAFFTVKSRTDLAPKGGGAFRGLVAIHLDDAAIDALVETKLTTNEIILRQRFPAWERFPADAQLGILSLAWAAGPLFAFPAFVAAANAGDWTTAADEGHLKEAGNNDALRRRNAADRALFLGAAGVVADGGDPSQLTAARISGAGGGSSGGGPVPGAGPAAGVRPAPPTLPNAGASLVGAVLFVLTLGVGFWAWKTR